MKRVNIRLSDEIYYELVKRYGVRGLSKGIEELLKNALTSKTLNVIDAKTQNVITSKTQNFSEKNTRIYNKSSPLDNIEDLAVIRRVRSPERLAEKCRERGLLFFDLGDAGMPGTVIVMNRFFASFVVSEAERDTISPSTVEETVSKLLREKESGYTDKEKYLIGLYVLSRAGEVLFNGKTWTGASPDKSSQT
jgi:predicted CopG family antitoxin